MIYGKCFLVNDGEWQFVWPFILLVYNKILIVSCVFKVVSLECDELQPQI